jgi:cysteine desulfurase
MEDVRVNGHQERRLPNTLNVSFKGIEAEALVATLSKKGICVSSGSACSSKKGERSHTLAAMGLEASFAKGAIRISLGKDNVQEHIDSFVQRVKESVDYLRTPSVLS